MPDSIHKSEAEIKLIEVLERALDPLSFRVVDMDLRVGPRSLLRIFIEKKESDANGSKAVSLGDCATVSRTLDPILEAENIFPRTYDLEVSSAGLDRRLRLKSDFEGIVGNEVKLVLLEKLQGVAANVRAKLLKVDGENLVLGYNGNEVPVKLEHISQASLIWAEKDER